MFLLLSPAYKYKMSLIIENTGTIDMKNWKEVLLGVLAEEEQVFQVLYMSALLNPAGRYVLQSQNNLDWKGLQRSSTSNPTAKDRDPFTGPGCSKPHATWP